MSEVSIRTAKPEEFKAIGELMHNVYSNLEGFPTEQEQPKYYEMLLNVGQLTSKPGVEILVAVDEAENVLGAVVNFLDMKHYGSGGTATEEENAGGFRLLAVSTEARGLGLGKKLTFACINHIKENGLKKVVIHTTKAMIPAWKMYEKIGFERSLDLDFLQGDLEVFGFRMIL